MAHEIRHLNWSVTKQDFSHVTFQIHAYLMQGYYASFVLSIINACMYTAQLSNNKN